MKRIDEIRVASDPKKAHDSEDPNADRRDGPRVGDIRFLNEDADKLFLCTGGGFR